MENKNLQLINLTIKEMIFLCSFAKTIKHYGIDGSIYHYGTYAEQKVCITKKMKINGKFTYVKEEIYLIKLLLNLVLMRAQNYLNMDLEQR